MSSFTILTSQQRRREILAAVPNEWKKLVAETGALLAESNTYRCPWCGIRLQIEAVDLPPVRKNEKTT